MKEVRTEIQINAEPSRIWDILVDFESYPKWNPFIRSIKGKPIQDSKIEIEIHTPSGKERHYSPKITSFLPNKELRWVGKIPGFLGGEHIFELSQQADGVVFVHKEIFTGLLVSAFGRSIDGDIRAGFESMNLALKERAEA